MACNEWGPVLDLNLLALHPPLPFSFTCERPLSVYHQSEYDYCGTDDGFTSRTLVYRHHLPLLCKHLPLEKMQKLRKSWIGWSPTPLEQVRVVQFYREHCQVRRIGEFGIKMLRYLLE